MIYWHLYRKSKLIIIRELPNVW